MNERKNWIEAVRAGDAAAYRHIVAKYKHAVYYAAYAVLYDHFLAEDAAQETFLQAFLRLSDLREPDKIGSWLYAISRRQSIRMKKKQSRLVPRENMDRVELTAESAEASVMRRQSHEQIWQSIGELDEKNRAATALYYMSEMSMKEIAGFLGISVRAVESRLQRAKKQLRVSLAALEDRTTVSYPVLGSVFEERIMREIPNLLRIPRIFVDVRDADYAEAWYEAMLGFDFHSREPALGVHISFREVPLPNPSREPILTFGTPDLEEALTALQAKKVESCTLSSDRRSFTFKDPFGNVLAFVAD